MTWYLCSLRYFATRRAVPDCLAAVALSCLIGQRSSLGLASRQLPTTSRSSSLCHGAALVMSAPQMILQHLSASLVSRVTKLASAVPWRWHHVCPWGFPFYRNIRSLRLGHSLAA